MARLISLTVKERDGEELTTPTAKLFNIDHIIVVEPKDTTDSLVSYGEVGRRKPVPYVVDEDNAAILAAANA